jgi:RNA polymerase sigma-70 factor (ECF subfamily)
MQTSSTAEFEQLAQDNMDAIYTRAIRMTKNTSQAENLVQSAFSHAYSKFDSFDRTVGFRNWLFQILEMKSLRHSTS